MLFFLASCVFDNLLSLVSLKSTAIVDKITLYLMVPLENVKDTIKWWWEKHNVYPWLSRMALNYLTIPGMQCLACMFNLLMKSTATSIDVEWLFSRGCLILLHTHSQLSVSSTWALLYLGSWSLMGLVRNKDVKAITSLDEIQGKIELQKLEELLRIQA